MAYFRFKSAAPDYHHFRRTRRVLILNPNGSPLNLTPDLPRNTPPTHPRKGWKGNRYVGHSKAAKNRVKAWWEQYAVTLSMAGYSRNAATGQGLSDRATVMQDAIDRAHITATTGHSLQDNLLAFDQERMFFGTGGDPHRKGVYNIGQAKFAGDIGGMAAVRGRPRKPNKGGNSAGGGLNGIITGAGGWKRPSWIAGMLNKANNPNKAGSGISGGEGLNLAILAAFGAVLLKG